MGVAGGGGQLLNERLSRRSTTTGRSLTADGGEPGRCGWLKDKFGLSWQIVPTALGEMLSDKDPAKGQRVLSAMLQMKKLDLGQLQTAYDGK